MENKKEIGKIFKDSLELLDKSPGHNVWTSIESDLNKKRKRRILFWLIPSFVIMGLVSSFFLFESKNNQNKSVNTEHENRIVTKTDNQKESLTKNKTVADSVHESVSSGKITTKKTIGNSSETKTTIRKSRTEKLVNQSSKLITTTDEYEEYEVVKKYKVIIRKNKTVTTTKKSSFVSKKPNSLAAKSNIIAGKSNKSSKKAGSQTVKKQQKNNVSKNKTKKVSTQKKQSIPSVSEETKPLKIEDPEKNNSPKITAKESLENLETVKKDTINILKQEKKTTPKREYIKREYPEQTNENEPEYSVSVFYGPAVFGSLSGKSTINESFNEISKSHPVTSHYGFYFKSMYGKYGFRAGISKISLKISNHINNQSTINYDNMVLTNDDIYSVMANDEDIRLAQKISYYEIPLEFNYAIKKDDTPYGIEAFTGVSALISEANQLYLSSNNLKSERIGSTKNLNKMNLSFNLGL